MSAENKMDSKETPVLTPAGPSAYLEQSKEYFDLALSVAAVLLGKYGNSAYSNLGYKLHYSKDGECYKRMSSWWAYKDARLDMCPDHTKLFSTRCEERQKNEVIKKLDTIISCLGALTHDRDVATICQEIATIAASK